MNQKSVKIGDVVVPVIEYDGVDYFPSSYITTKVLLRSGKNSLLTKKKRDEYSDHIKKFNVDFGESNIQESNCINTYALKELLKNTHVGRLTVEQRRSQNELHRHLGMELLPIDQLDSEFYDNKWEEELDDYTREIVKNELNTYSIILNKECLVRRCTKCYKHLPLTNRFFAIDDRAEKGFVKICRVCAGIYKEFTHQDNMKNRLKRVSTDLVAAFNNNAVCKIYESYLKCDLKRLPDCYENKDSYKKIIEYLYVTGRVTNENLTIKLLKNDFKLEYTNKFFTPEDIYSLLFGESFYIEAWKYPKYSFKNIKLTFDIGNKIIKAYLNHHNIVIDDIFNFNYEELFAKCRIRKLTNGNSKYFVVQHYNFEYAGYKFKLHSNNYYKDEKNVLFDLKYLVEKDMKIPVEKIPLYLTKFNLQKKCNQLYHHIVTNKNKSIFEWIDMLYPNKFIEADFEINPYRNEYDSDDEMYIHEILEEEFPKQVIYNQRNNGEIRLKGKVPDWFIFTDHGVWVVEYFGMLDNGNPENSRIKDYRNKYEDKLELYKTLNGYKFLYLYREDIVDDFKGCREKIQKVKENIDVVRV